MSKIRHNTKGNVLSIYKEVLVYLSLRVVAYFAHCHYLVFIEDVSGKTGPQRWRPLSSNGKLIDEKALIGHGKKAVKVNMLPQAPQ